jgi:hypothetical protein
MSDASVEKAHSKDEKDLTDADAVAIERDVYIQNPKERLSAYFTIAAAACGLISDGCLCNFSFICNVLMLFHRSEQFNDHVKCTYANSQSFTAFLTLLI